MIGSTHGCLGLALPLRGLIHLGVQQTKTVVQIAQRCLAVARGRGGEGLQQGCHMRQGLGCRACLGCGFGPQGHKINDRSRLFLDPDMGGFRGLWL